ncbi:uncharacterized protein LOC107261908 [Ricinus communis]|uniref:uncharacterized protein LOC107261908 n=1 Tax=Ricinus communis TaxID=3988 RepID=UPI00201A3FE2|nr:uncharacterized protein LOC107261908 [Ricinus communis]
MLFERQQGLLPSIVEPNPREHVNAIMLRSGKFVPGPSSVSNTNTNAQVDSSRKIEATKAKELEKEEAKEVSLMEYQSKISYPTRLKQAQMPRYAKFLKDILSNKRKFEDSTCMTLNEECKLPINDALADLGAEINVMPYNLFVKLVLGETKPTRMSIQLADRYVKYPKGIVENVLVKVNKFIFPVNFVILDMDSESSVPLILGRPFLATSRAMIDVCDGKLKLRVEDETVTFDLHNPISQSLDYKNVMYAVNVIDDDIETQLQEVLVEDPLHVTL